MKIFIFLILVSQLVSSHGAYTKGKLDAWKDSVRAVLAEHEGYIGDDMLHKKKYHEEQKGLKVGTGQAHTNLVELGDGLLFGRIIDGLLGLFVFLGVVGKSFAYLKSKGLTFKIGIKNEDSNNG